MNMFIKAAIIYLIAISGILIPLCHATNVDIIYEYYESLTACIKPENYNNVNDLIDEWLEFFTDDMEFCEGVIESDATCYDKSGLKVEMLESIDNIHKEHAPESVQYAYIIENEYGDDITTKYELMLSSKHCITTLKESHKFTFEGDKIKKVFSYDMEDEEDCSPTTTKSNFKSGNSYDSDEDICSLPKLTGGCEGFYDRWYYNGKECEEFTYSGCEGNDNNFESLAECELECDSKTKKPDTTEPKEYIIESTTKEPTKKKTWDKDTESPTKSPSAKWTTSSPTYKPTNKPTPSPTYKPTDKPTPWPTKKPTDKPSEWPTKSPTYKPTEKPTNKPTYKPTGKPTKSPTEKPTYKPTYKPTKSPTDKPTTAKPTKAPTEKPTKSPTEKPTKSPITDKPTKAPTNKPTEKPTKWPTASPTQKPTYSPTKKPTTKAPTKWPTAKPTAKPTYAPTDKPTTPKPTGWPTQKPTTPKPTTPKPTTAKPTIWEKKTEEPTVWKKETKEPTVWAKKTNKPTPSPTINDEYKVEETKY